MFDALMPSTIPFLWIANTTKQKTLMLIRGLEFFDVVFVFVYAFVFVLDKIAHDGTATQGEGWSGVALGGACQSQHLMDLLLCTDRTLQLLAVLSVGTVFAKKL